MTAFLASPLEVYLLGLVEVDDLLALQRKLVYDLGERPGGALILCEHTPTITVGRNGSRAHILADDEELRASGIRTRWVNRGGGCLLHAPGQLMVYLILPLEPHARSLAGYLNRLGHVIREVLADFDLRNQVHTDAWGVRLGSDRVATLGISVRRWITSYGFALNVNPAMAPYQLVSSSAAGGRSTSMEARRQRPTSMAKVRESVLRHVEAVFGVERHAFFTSHPLLRRTTVPHVYTSCAS